MIVVLIIETFCFGPHFIDRVTVICTAQTRRFSVIAEIVLALEHEGN